MPGDVTPGDVMPGDVMPGDVMLDDMISVSYLATIWVWCCGTEELRGGRVDHILE